MVEVDLWKTFTRRFPSLIMITRASREVDERHRRVVKALGAASRRRPGHEQQIVSDSSFITLKPCSTGLQSFPPTTPSHLDDLTMATID